LSKFDNWFSSYSQKCQVCFFGDTVYVCLTDSCHNYTYPLLASVVTTLIVFVLTFYFRMVSEGDKNE